jgi:hypothetical protein
LPDNPFDTPDAPEQVNANAEAQTLLAEGQVQLGEDQLAWSKDLAQLGYNEVKPITDLQTATQQNQFNRGLENQSYYDSTFKPSEGLSTLDAYGLPWLGEEAQNTMIDSMGGQQGASLTATHQERMSQLDLQEQRALENQFPATGGEGDTSGGAEGIRSDYATQRESAQSEYDNNMAQINRSTVYL